jgi:hypothetical protein
MSYSYRIKRMRSAPVAALAALTAALTCGACDDSPTAPTDAATVTFQVADETFKVKLTTKEQVEAAQAAKNGGPARIPNGRIVTGSDVNVGWSWHLVDVSFAEATIEVCDGKPSDVERAGVTFGAGRFCPWTARILAIRAD